MSVGVVNLSESKGHFANYFEFFQLPQRYTIDRKSLDAAYLKIQQEVHPDRYVRASDSEKRQSLQIATYANTAYQTLKQGVKRGLYLCELHGLDPALETNTAMPREFLMQQMEFREAMEEAKGNLLAMSQLQDQVQLELKHRIDAIGQQFDEKHAPEAALLNLRAALFLERLLEELDQRISDASE
jgi:molecular chaperone HscB